MKFDQLTIKKRTKPTRVGRGISAGKGKTAGRGTKGQGSRKSGGVRPGFEGGQMPLYMRIPRLRGFKSKKPITYNVTTGQLAELKLATIDAKVLAGAGLVPSEFERIKLIKKGELTKKIVVKLERASLGAIKQIENVGGKFEKSDRLMRPKQNKLKKDQK